MEYRTLENIDSVCIYEAFTQAFSDYQVSVGAFADKTLVGFILNGVREWDSEKTIYDLGTGVIPDFRRTGIMGELLDLVSTICIKNKISVYQLEVIQDNEKAITLYKKQGNWSIRKNCRMNNGQQSKIFGLIRPHGKTQKTLFAQLLNPFIIRLLNLMET